MSDLVVRINVGCGQTPTEGWDNYDNSISILLAKFPLFVRIITKLKLISDQQIGMINTASEHKITWANAVVKIPKESSSVDVVYTSHVLEHLDREEAKLFLQEILRVLKPNGILRIVVPDLKILVNDYLSSGNADNFLKSTYLTVQQPKKIIQKIKIILVGYRHHLWMYDGPSLIQLLLSTGYRTPIMMEPGSTTITQHGRLNLLERADQSVIIEAIKK